MNKNIKWRSFVDKDGNNTYETIMNGSEFSRQLTDVYFELKITKRGELLIEIEDDYNYFYKRKLEMIYINVYKTIYKLFEKGEFAFYNEKNLSYCKITEKKYSTVINNSW